MSTAALGELGEEDFERWRSLERRSEVSPPYLSADFFESMATRRPDTSTLRLLRVEDASGADGQRDLLLLMPFTVRRLPARWTIPVTSNRDDSRLTDTFLLDPLVDEDRGEAAWRALLGALRPLGLPDLLDLHNLAVGSALSALERAAGPQRIVERERKTRLHLTLGEPSEVERPLFDTEFLPSSYRRRLGQLGRRLESSLEHPLELVDRSDDPDVVEEFLRLQDRGWKGDRARGGAGYVVRGDSDWFREVGRAFQASGRFRALELRSGGDTLYLATFLTSGTTLFGLQDVYAEELATYRVGTLGRLAAVGWARGSGLGAFDPHLEAGSPETSRLFPDRLEQVSLLVAGPAAIALVRLRAYVGLRAARRLVSRAGSIASRLRHGWRPSVRRSGPR